MNNAQILAMLNAPIYQDLPTLQAVPKVITFNALIREVINFIDGLRMRRYMVLKINQELNLANDYDIADDEALEELINEGFGEGEQLWIDRFTSIVEEASEEQLFIMLNILGILNLGQPGEEMLNAMNINNDAINIINNNNAIDNNY
jgi:hypothetical protein